MYSVTRVIINQSMVYSGSNDNKIKAWSIPSATLKYEVAHLHSIYDVVIGREGTPLSDRILSISFDSYCRISNLETGTEIKRIEFDNYCYSIAVDKGQTLIAIGNGEKVTFIETSDFTIAKEVTLDGDVFALAFNQRNDCLLAVTEEGKVHSFKF